MRGRFDEQLDQLNNMLIEMGTLIETAIALVTQALRERDTELAKKAIAYEEDIDEKEKAIEALCLNLLLRQQPVARDLRLISSALKMITDMERIGDQVCDIAEIAIMLNGAHHIQKLGNITQMAQVSVKMVTNSIDAFVKKDLELAETVIKNDDVIDGLFEAVMLELIELIRADSANGMQALYLLMIAKYFERIGDHAENIAEWVVFSITGKSVKG